MTEIEKRRTQALESIRQAFGTEAGDDSVNLFINHHLEELPESYWERHLENAPPKPIDVLGLLHFRSSWGENDCEYFDFTLPDDATNYVVSVHFDSASNIDSISMES